MRRWGGHDGSPHYCIYIIVVCNNIPLYFEIYHYYLNYRHKYLHIWNEYANFASIYRINMHMNVKSQRLEAIKLLLSSKEIGSQEDLLSELRDEGYYITQATLSRDLKQLKVAKAASMNGQYVYVLPNETMYRRVHTPLKATEMMTISGFQSINFSGNIGVIHTRPGYASSIAFNIDNSDIPEIMGTIAGDDTIFIAVKEGADHNAIIDSLRENLIL